jgi:hypothetical protein
MILQEQTFIIILVIILKSTNSMFICLKLLNSLQLLKVSLAKIFSNLRKVCEIDYHPLPLNHVLI